MKFALFHEKPYWNVGEWIIEQEQKGKIWFISFEASFVGTVI